jgi:hypothetical protein
MAYELEALVGHLYVAGGRTIKTTPPGALSEVAPKKAARGRELDTLFVLVLPSGTQAPVSFYEQMAVMATERYFTTTGSVTSALRDVFNTLNNNLFEHNASGRKHYEANMICAVLRNNELYLARVGACAAILRLGGDTQTLPETLSDEESLFQPPLGVTPIPEVQMKRYTADSGSRLLLVDANIAEIKSENVINALIANNIEQALDDYRQLVTNQTQAMLVEFVPPDVVAPVAVIAGESSKAINATLNNTRTTAETPAIETALNPSPTTPTLSIPKKPNPVVAFFRRIVGTIARFVGSLMSSLGQIMGRFLGRNVDSRTVRYGAGFATTVLFALPIAVVLIVVVSWAAGIGETRFETCVSQALDAGNLARGIDPNNPQSILAAWQASFLKINECNTIRSGDLMLANLKKEGQTVVDRLNNIERRPLIALASLPNAQITDLVLQGLDMYALDSQNNLVYRWQIAADGVTTANTPQPITTMRKNATVDGLLMGDILAVTYDSTLDVVVALGRNGVLFQCPPRFINECDGQQLLSSDTWGNPISVSIWRGNLYILDTVGNQLWRYQPSGGNYAGVPTEYFIGTLRPDLTTAVDFSISTAGNTAGAVYVLYNNGVMTKHFSGEPDPFAFAGFPDGLALNSTTVNALFLNDSPIDTAFYVLSPATRTIYETSIAGSFIASYRVEDEDKLANMTDVVTDPSQQIMYVAAGNTVYAIQQNK